MSPPSEKVGDTFPVSPTKLRPWIQVIEKANVNLKMKYNTYNE